MRRIGLCLLAVVALCSGQVCGPAASSEPDTPDLGLPIPAGTYTGELSVTSRVLLNGLQFGASKDPLRITQAFGADGLPLTDANEPMIVGYKVEEQTPNGTTTMTVRSIDAGGNSVAIAYDASMSLTTAGQTTVLTGTETRTYTPKVDGTLYVAVTMDISGTAAAGAVIQTVMDGGGSLAR